MNEIFNNAQKKQNELNEKILNSADIIAHRPVFHFATPGGWCNDPNGFSQFGDKIHLFYQYHPYSTQWGPMHWGHVVSNDMLNWDLQPVALAPDSSADYKGCFSGTAIEHEGKHILAYTGVTNNGTVDIQNQCIAIGDGRKIMIGWMQAWESYITPKNYMWSGMMTLPRELSFKNNRLYQLPVRELENWKSEKKYGNRLKPESRILV